MPDREKVIKAMEWCQENACDGCPYDTHNNESCGISDDILTLLKEQETVVQCRDCKYGTEMSGNIICHKPKHDEYETDIRPFDWFCADGERR